MAGAAHGDSVLIHSGKRPEVQYVSRFLVGWVKQRRFTPVKVYMTKVKGGEVDGQIAPTPTGYTFINDENHFPYEQTDADGQFGEHLDYFEGDRTAWEDLD